LKEDGAFLTQSTLKTRVFGDFFQKLWRLIVFPKADLKKMVCSQSTSWPGRRQSMFLSFFPVTQSETMFRGVPGWAVAVGRRSVSQHWQNILE